MNFIFVPEEVDFGDNWQSDLATEIAKKGHLVVFCNSTQLDEPQPVKCPFYPDPIRFQLDRCWIQRVRFMTPTDPAHGGMGGAKWENSICLHTTKTPPEPPPDRHWLASVMIEDGDDFAEIMNCLRGRPGLLRNAWVWLTKQWLIFRCHDFMNKPSLWLCEKFNQHAYYGEYNPDTAVITAVTCIYCGKPADQEVILHCKDLVREDIGLPSVDRMLN